ncbi:MAG: hypothetical protein LBH98_10560 [Chitinispirillales bacterium]|nr:hypothetical protein [Chitinispirillales bacterium]
MKRLEMKVYTDKELKFIDWIINPVIKSEPFDDSNEIVVRESMNALAEWITQRPSCKRHRMTFELERINI